MIGFLRGTVVRAAPDEILLDVRGVGYRVHIPLSTYYEVEKTAGDGDGALDLFVHTHVRDDTLALFGFWTEGELRLFEKLIGVSGIGPRLAQAILSGMPAAELAAAIRDGDLRRLVAIPGVGKKTAERMVLELRERVEGIVAAPKKAPAAARVEDDVVEALVNLGYKRPQAERAVRAAHAETSDLPVAELLRAALRRLSKV